ncbi:hypothetical protein [Azospirillum thermophilum]|uniref:outer membrane lipoprotein n=1 Tax=Azospirillum thermophilum TaxID=2202148 RepID=UPI001FE944FB|nr:hypothetical protein [Azospirillum thermophilum]
MLRTVSLCLRAAVIVGLAGCTSDYSPNTYSGSAVQQTNKVETGVVVGFREVSISAGGTVGAVSGGAAGGILGAQVGTGGMNSALGTVGGTALGSIVGTTLEHITGDTTGWEYIVRKPNGEMVSVTQREPKPLPIGQKVLVIGGAQARIIPDYSSPVDPAAADPAKTDPAKTEAAKPAAEKPKTAEEAKPAPAPEPARPQAQPDGQGNPAAPVQLAPSAVDPSSPFATSPVPAPAAPQVVPAAPAPAATDG